MIKNLHFEIENIRSDGNDKKLFYCLSFSSKNLYWVQDVFQAEIPY